ncbi:hypothetical protein NSK_003979 [Nannochloropsis salina CCMP1776]|uniref:Lysosomal dipeptide transporter MFSD1 n=1 Tax=Nannochloropsis salina CCMP1776 TaxID=1027361 RepID=A0A4D9CZX0_9STRA|nr:hypothetical protein NSK_003979 [Nannochloropsis salina CCMP1776]|eukprot:TFJ84951.1 hypothetical protein NSK_003979 [Nannochloropsis salina CCMP1776]
MLSNYFVYDIPASLKDLIRQNMGLDKSEFEPMYSLFYTVYSLPNIVLPFFGGIFVDKFGARICLIAFTLFLLVGQIFFALGGSYHSFPLMLLGRTIYGLGGENMSVAQSSLVAEWFRVRKEGGREGEGKEGGGDGVEFASRGAAFAAVLWPSVPFTVPEDRVGVAYGLTTAIQNAGLALFPLMAAAIYKAAGSEYIPHVELLFVYLAVVGLAFGLWLNVLDSRAGNVLNRAHWAGGKGKRDKKPLLHELMHIGCGPIFLLCWPLFSSLPSASYFAAGAPLALTSFFTIVGLGIIVNPATVKSMSRTALCISCLCAGDGFADVVGRKFAPAVPSYGFEKKQDDVLRRQKPLGRGRIPWCPSKSWIGTVGFIVASSFTSACFVLYSSRQGWTIDDGGRHGRKGMERVWRRVWGSTLLSAAAESLPVPEGWDNLMVFGAALLADWLVMRGARTSV